MKKNPILKNYMRLEGSERPPSQKTKLLGPADPKETFSVTIVLRRRIDGPPVPSFDYFAKTPLSQRRRMGQEEFAAKYGAAPEDINKVVEFAHSHGLTVVETHATRRKVVISGTVAQMSKAFVVTLGRYHRVISNNLRPEHHPSQQKFRVENYRGLDGAIHIPKTLSGIIVGVFGLDNRNITRSNGQPGDPLNPFPLTIQKATDLYNFPTPPSSIIQQTVGILSFGGYFLSDLQLFFGAAMPKIIPIPVDAVNFSTEVILTAQTSVGSNTLVFAPTSGIPIGSSLFAGTAVTQLGGFPNPANSSGPAVMAISTTASETTVTVGTYDFSTGIWTPAFATSVIPVMTNVYFNLDNETTQDICIAGAASAASSGVQGAAVAVYFSSGDESGWVDMIHRAVHPDPNDFLSPINPPSVLSSSFTFNGGDDPYAMNAGNLTTSLISAVHDTLQDAAIQGVTVCFASGDYGSNCLVGNNGNGGGDNKAHVGYPSSDPWVLSVGGTELGGNLAGSPPPWVEFVWNNAPGLPLAWGTTGGGVSDFFPVPSYQTSAGITPTSINTTADSGYPPFNPTGRGIPDVAANASYDSGYTNLYFGGATGWYLGNGTSASTPFWAGLIALINANLGFNVGFINPILYALGSSVFNPINPLNPSLPGLSGCPTSNSNGGIPGYPATAGWDACTGWGSPNGNVLLNAIKTGLTQDCYFIVDTGTFDLGAVAEGISASGSIVFQQAFFVVIEGFTASQLGISAATVNNAINNPPSIQPQLTGFPAGMAYSLVSIQAAEAFTSSGLNSPQRFTYSYNVTFINTSAFPTTSGQAIPLNITATVAATINGSVVTLNSSSVFELIDQPGPYMAGGSGISWLSSDIRVFQVEPGEWALPAPPYPLQGTEIVLYNTGNPVIDATNFIQSAIQSLNSGTNLPPAGLVSSPGGPIPSYFDLIPTGEDASALDLLQIDPANSNPVYNFALARIRYNSSAIAAQNVRAFFRLIPALSVSTSFDSTTTYRRWTDGTEVIPLYGLDSSGDVISIPCFADTRVDASSASVETQTDSANIQTIPANGGEVDVYFGCWLDINQPTDQYPLNVGGLSSPDGPFAAPSLQTIQQLMRNLHQCLVVEIAYDPDPIQQGAAPSTSGPLAQRNLSLGTAANPGESASRSVPNTFLVRPTSTKTMIGQKPDELMIDWRNTPAGSLASIYWPQVSAAQVLRMAALMYTTHNLTMTDSHTLQVPVGGITYIPLPSGTNAILPGLISVDLPWGIRKGQSFKVIVRQITGATQKTGNDQNSRFITLRSWRRILGSFQLTIAVLTKEVMLAPEERALSVMRWIQQSIPATDKWFAVINRYVLQIAERVGALGGNPATILPSSSGGVTAGPVSGQKPPDSGWKEYTGKVNGLKYDLFGDFEGFFLRTEHGDEKYFQSREHEIEELVDRAWVERIVISVFTQRTDSDFPTSIVLRRVH